MNNIAINKITLSFQICGVIFIIIGAIFLFIFIFSSARERFENLQKLILWPIIGGAALFIIASYLPKINTETKAYQQENERLSYIITAYYDVESMRLVKEEDWSLFIHLGTNEYIEAVYTKDGKRKTQKFNTDAFYERIRIDQHDKNAVGAAKDGETYLYISQEDYDRILGYE